MVLLFVNEKYILNINEQIRFLILWRFG